MIIPKVAELKLTYWDHEGVNLHSRDIRKREGPFSFMMRKEYRDSFLSDLSSLMNESDYTVFVTAIDKISHLKKWGKKAENPYTVALKNCVEDITSFLRQSGENELPLIAEARGKNEDGDLENAFYKIINEHTDIGWSLVFQNKLNNIAGIQLADLVAHPAARSVLKPEQKNQAWDIVKEKFYRKKGVRIIV